MTKRKPTAPLMVYMSYNIMSDEFMLTLSREGKNLHLPFIGKTIDQDLAKEFLNFSKGTPAFIGLSDGVLLNLARAFCAEVANKNPDKIIPLNSPSARLFPAFPAGWRNPDSRPLFVHYFRLFRFVADYLISRSC